jgi:hypothetical protein
MTRAMEESVFQDKKKAGSENCLPKGARLNSDIRLGLAETLDTVSRLPLATLLEQVDALEALQDVAFDDEAGRSLETFVL